MHMRNLKLLNLRENAHQVLPGTCNQSCSLPRKVNRSAFLSMIAGDVLVKSLSSLEFNKYLHLTNLDAQTDN